MAAQAQTPAVETGDVTSLKSFLGNQQYFPLPLTYFVVIQPLAFKTDRFRLPLIFFCETTLHGVT